MDARPQFQILNSPGKIINYYLREQIHFEVSHPVHEYTKMWIHNKRYKPTQFALFEILVVPKL